MRILVIYCHPVETSYHACLHEEVLKQLRSAGHEVDDCDLYAEQFNPVLSREERLGYHEVPSNRIPVQGYVDRLLWAEGLVFCFPTWCFGLPAMLKGFFDRVLMPGVAFDLSDPAHVKPSLTHLKHIAAVVTYGRPWWMALYMGDPPRRMITGYLKILNGGRAKFSYMAHYHMNIATPASLKKFKDKVALKMRNFSA
jgi:putative NADPH-quinone reductase